MTASRHALMILSMFVAAMLAMESPAHAWYRHRNYRSYRMGRTYNRSANAQRAAIAVNAARGRLNAAQLNAARQLRQARQQALNSPNLTSAKSAYATATRDFQEARDAAVTRLKANHPEFRELLAQCQDRRTRIATLAKSGDTSGAMESLQSELKTMARKVVQIEDQALRDDPVVKDITLRKGEAYSHEQAAEKLAQNSVAQNPGVLAAQKQVAQAQLQLQQATARYGSSLASVGTGFSPRRRGYGPRWSGSVVRYQTVNRFHHSHHSWKHHR